MKRPDLTKLLTVFGGILVVVVIMAAFIIQNHEYDSLLGLYAKQQHQLLANGIIPSGPSAAQLLNTGATGPAGAIGANGPKGEAGYPGSTGDTGATGVTGAAGAPGAAGASGVTGATGAAGTAGQTGATGADGAPGGIGATGADGVPVLSWTYITALGVLKQCNRDIPFDPKAPTYNCMVVPVVPLIAPIP